MRRHDLDVFSLAAGLVFGVVALGRMLDDGARFVDLRWVVPVLMVAVGVASLAGLLRGGRAEAGPDHPARADRADRADREDTVVLDRGPAEAD